jgi:hypothetical protein
MSEIIGPMLRLFREGAKSYQPGMNGLDPETGDPQVSLENIRRVVAAGPMIREMLVRPTGVLVLFDGGEQFYAPGLRVGTNGPATEALARIAAEAGFGAYDRLLSFYQHLPESYSGQLPNLIPHAAPTAAPAS